ncbi:hypothetical protein diail_4367 [Diaporthe ilicicola]|nr:hypothetical protein diail_4367 [Diaporthe ilicicola]
MPPQNAQKREYSAAELAMLDDIGAGRVDTLPLQDSGPVPHGGAAMSSIERGRTSTNNRWNQAIADGMFDDDDAAVVAGQDDLANGHLARMRRAADLSYMTVNRGIDFNDRRLRQDNGQVSPRSQFVRPQRGYFPAGKAHNGDGPVELRGARPNSRHAPVSNGALPPVPPKAHGVNQASPSHARASDGPQRPTQRAAAPTPSIARQPGVQEPLKTMSLDLPSGFSVFFRTRAKFASPTFLNRTAEYPGTIYLVAGPVPTADQIILHIDEDQVEDVKRRANEYVDHLSDTDRLILQFKDDAGRITWFVVVFHQRDAMVSAVEALRKLVNRPKEASSSPINSTMGPATVETPTVLVNRPQEASPSPVTTNVGPTAANTSAVTFEPPRESKASMTAIPEEQDATMTIPVHILELIVSWTMDMLAFIRESGPAELANADALPGIIRGASAAVLAAKQANFLSLDVKQRKDLIVEICAPQVFERLKRRMIENSLKQEPSETDTTTESSAQKAPDVQVTTPHKLPRLAYTVRELIQLESAATDPPSFLTELRYLPEIGPATKDLIQRIIRQASGSNDTSMPMKTPKIQNHAGGRDLHTSPVNTDHGLDGSISPAITVTAPDEEPLISVSGEMNGLNSSRHNKNGVDRLGKSARHFTGSLSKNNSHWKDLALIDNEEDVDVIRANDPEIAEIADRFARIHFEQEQTA